MATTTPTIRPLWQRLARLSGGRDGAQKVFLFGAISPMVLYMAFFTLLPILWAAALAFFEYSARRNGGPILGLGGDNPYVGLHHFQNMLNFSAEAPLEVRQFHTSLKTTLLFALLVLPLNFLITLPLAALIEAIAGWVRPVFRTIFFLPVVTSAVGVAIMWGFILHPQRGLLNGLLTLINDKLTVIGWVTDPNLFLGGVPVALLAVIAAYLWQDFGYNLVIFIAALQAIPEHIKDAARVDGVNGWQMFIHITLPLLRPTILLAAVLTMISSFQVFDIIQVMTDGGPNNLTRVLVIDIYENAFRFQRMGWAAAVSVVLFLLVFSISIIQTRLLSSDWEY
jgi:ABC-type sugar transport system permease subunit